MNIISTKIVTNRKPHKCNACGRSFGKGSKMEVTAISDSGSVYNWRNCTTCTELLNKHQEVFADEMDHTYDEFCVLTAMSDYYDAESLEDLLEQLNAKKNYKNSTK